MFMQIGELFEICWPSSLSFKLIKVGPIVSDGGLQVGSGGPGSRGVTSMKCLRSLRLLLTILRLRAMFVEIGTHWGKQNGKVLR